MHNLQPCQLGNDSLLSMALYPLLDMREGASLCKAPEEISGGFGVAPVTGVRSGHDRSGMGVVTEISPCHRGGSNQQPSA